MVRFVHFIWQSGWGAYAGTVQADWHNPAALRNEEGDPLQFDNWTEGITAHVDHLALLAGQEGYPLDETPDPKHTAERLGTAPTVEDLGTAYGDPLWTSKTLELLEALAATVTEADPVDGTPIMGPSTTTVEDMRKWAESRNANPLFVELAQTFYDVAVEVGVDPAVIYTQSAKETNFMHFTGVLDASFMNPCGLKTSGGGGDYDPDAHHRFESWEQGIRAQADHLALYAGAEGYPDPNSPDPRHFPSIAGVAPTVEELGGRWAPSPTYGREIVVMMEQLYSVNDPDYNVGDQDGQPIMNEPTATVEQMVLWAESKNADQDFIDLAQAFYDISVSKGVDPIVTYAHAALATDFFAFERSVIDKSFYSTANIKTSVAGPDEDPNSFQRFADWEEGILAHVDHLGLYAGGEGYPDENSPDPRHFPSIKGTAPTVESLGGRWIPRADYGTEILAAMEEIWAMEVVEEEEIVEEFPIDIPSYVTAGETTDNAAFVNPAYLDLLDRIIQAEHEFGLTGIQLAIYQNGQLMKNSAYGYLNNYYNYLDADGNLVMDHAKVLPVEERTPVTPSHLFDWASNTKMFVTTYALQQLVANETVVPNTGELLSLDTRLADIFPVFLEQGNEQGWKDDITLSQILSHTSGFADRGYHNDAFVTEEYWSHDKARTFDILMRMPLAAEPNSRYLYTDTDMMIAGFVIEELSGLDLDTYVKTNIYRPLGLNRLTFNPMEHGYAKGETSAAELHGNTRDGRYIYTGVRTEVVQGEAHDEKAYYSMDGVAGHAGLMGPAQEIAYLGQAMYNYGDLGGQKLFDQKTINDFIAPNPLRGDQGQGGWRVTSNERAYYYFTPFAPVGTVGHTGWTGTFTLVDPVNNISLALATNTRNNPIENRASDLFFTRNFNVDGYYVVAELMYRALGLVNDGVTPEQYLMDLINAEIPEDIAGTNPSKRNVLRSQMQVLEEMATNSPALADFLASETIQNVITELQPFYGTDMNFLVVQKHLDELIVEAEAIDTTPYTEETVAVFEEVLARAIASLDRSGLGEDEWLDLTQEQVDALAEELRAAIDQLAEIDPRLELPLTESTPDSVDATVYANTLEDHGLIVEILPLERILEDRLVEAYEIRVYDRASGERVYETVGPLSFEITLAMDIDNQLELYHDVDGALVEVPITSIEGQVVRFEAASFSPYLFVMPAPVDETEPTATETIDPSTDESSSIPSEEASEATTPTVSTDDSDDVPATGETNYSMLVGISILGIAALLVVVAVVLKKRREE